MRIQLLIFMLVLIMSGLVSCSSGQETQEIEITIEVKPGYEVLADLNPGGSSHPYNLYVYNDKLYFFATSGGVTSMWVYDGGVNLHQAENFNPDIVGFPASSLKEFNNKLFFRAIYESSQHKLWSYDAVNGNVCIIDAFGDLYPEYLCVFNGKLYFSGKHPEKGTELFVYDGSGTPALAEDINPGGSSSPKHLVVFKNKLFFYASDGGNDVWWSYDGENAPVKIEGTGENVYWSPRYHIIMNDVLYFAARNASGEGIWQYDGETAPFISYDMADTPLTGLYYFSVLNGYIYFMGNDELWKYDGIAPPELAYVLNESGTSVPQFITTFNNTLYFSGNNGINGHELVVYDGIHTPIIIDIYPGGSSFPKNFTAFNGQLYFSAYTKEYGHELCRLR